MQLDLHQILDGISYSEVFNQVTLVQVPQISLQTLVLHERYFENGQIQECSIATGLTSGNYRKCARSPAGFWLCSLARTREPLKPTLS